MIADALPGLIPTTFGEYFTADEFEYPELRVGLVGAWWPPEASGGQFYDLSGYGNHGTLTNMDPATDWVISDYSTPPGWALDLDNAAIEYIDIPNLSPPANYTMFWAGRLAEVDREQHIAEFWGTQWYISGSNKMIVYDSVVGYDNNHTYVANEKFTAAMEYIGSDMAAYLNGELVISPTTQSRSVSTGLTIGNLYTQAHFFAWGGLISVLYIYNEQKDAAWHARMHADPLAPLRLRRRKVWKVPVAPGGLTLLDFERATYRGANRGVMRGVG